MGEREFNEREFTRVFKILDKDGNGRITKNEMRDFIKLLIDQPQPEEEKNEV
jgi:Ca2+-binding EF-hand superfamily protein